MEKINKMMISLVCTAEPFLKKIVNRKVISFMFAFFMVFSLALAPAYADTTSEISDAIRGGLKNVYSILLTVALPLGVIGIAVCGILMIWGDNTKTSTYKNNLIRIAIALAIIFLAPLLVTVIKSWFGAAGSSKEAEVFGS